MSWLLALSAGTLLWLGWRPAVRALVRWRLGPSRHTTNQVDPSKPRALQAPKPVAVVGGGIAGIAAAATLASRGYAVTLFEAETHLGGKLGAWSWDPAQGLPVPINHGFHAFFRHYYNLNRFLDALGLRATFRAISDYRILLLSGEEISFGKLDRTPVLNLLSMAKAGLYRLRDVLRAPARDLMGVFLEYDPRQTPERLDGMSFADFDAVARLPPRLKLAFSTFARAFFADEDKLSLAELVKSFHFYYLGHDGGLVYDYPVRDYEASLLAPIRSHLAQLKVTLKLGTPVTALTRDAGGFTVDGQRFDSAVLATDVVGTRAILENSSGLQGLDPRLLRLQPGQRYAVLRLWLDSAARQSLPIFVVTERGELLDAIALTDRIEAESAAFVTQHGGSVVELHCYAVPDGVDEANVAGMLVRDLRRLLPELRQCVVRHQHLQLRRDFTAFHVGMWKDRPVTSSGVPGLVCAGDWVNLPFPAMLLEAAFSSGLVAANRLLAADGLQEEPVDAVPLRGLLAGLPEPPTRRRWMAELGTRSGARR